MKEEHYTHYLYLINFGDYVKIGVSYSITNRLKDLIKISGNEIDFENSFLWKGVNKDVEMIERWMILKYKNKNIRTLIRARETFEVDVTEKIMDDIEKLREIVNIRLTKPMLLKNVFRFDGYNRNGVPKVYTHKFYENVVVPKMKTS